MKKSRKIAMEGKNVNRQLWYEPWMGNDNAPSLLPNPSTIGVDDEISPDSEEIFGDNSNLITFVDGSRKSRIERLARRLADLG